MRRAHRDCLHVPEQRKIAAAWGILVGALLLDEAGAA